MLNLIASLALASTSAAATDMAELRDEAICNIGWVAGNAYGHPIWPQVRDFVGEGGTYYDAFVRLRAPGESDELAASANVALYQECRERGQGLAFNERASISRIQRVIDISEELRGVLR